MGKTSKRSTNPVPKPKGASRAIIVVKQQKKKGKSSGRLGKGRVSVVTPSKMNSLRRMAPTATGLAGLPSAYFHSEKSSPGSMRIRGLENLGRLSSSAPLKLKESFSVNPLNERLFPRTSVLALPFESYEINALKIYYLPACQASLQGNVLMYYDYDPADSPKATDLDVLAQTTKTASSMWCPCELNIDCERIRANRPRYFVQSSNSLQAGSTISAAEVRQDYAGTINVYCSDGPSTDAFGGYLFLEYDISFQTMVPARAVSAAWSNPNSFALTESTTQYFPLPSRESGVGLLGGDTSTAGSSWLSAGGIAGLLDGARQIYEAGEWLLTLRSEVSAATFKKDSRDRQVGSQRNAATPLPGAPGWLSVREDDESAVVTISKDTPIDETGRPLVRGASNGVMAAGDFSLVLGAYDVSDGVIDPDWPITATGMTYAGINQVVAYTTTAAFDATNCWDLTVPAGKRYMVRPYVLVGATAGSDRTFGDISLTANVVSQSE